jgi:caa(3)-type oxidase subunit IV
MADSHEQPESDKGLVAPAYQDGSIAPGSHHELAGAEHHTSNVKAYLVVFAALCVVTTISFLANMMVRAHIISPFTSFAIILGVAVFKATLVAMYFMHLISDWKKVYILIVPTLVLGPMLVIVLLPDIVLAWKNVPTP